MSVVFEVLTQGSFDTAITGSFTPTSGSWEGVASHLYVTESISQYSYTVSHASGTWEGHGKMLAISDDVTESDLVFPQGWTVTVIQGIDDDAVSVNHDDDKVISNADPHVLEGANLVPWNPFPPPPAEPPGIRQQRDESRFKKVSSFSRFQPVRIRVFRRNVTVR